ncbi:MAG: hypothetical protein M3Y25_04270 [Thermoproteota archaeon]|nr:hypothetical protein [Thermoproteota archaeon]
MKDTYNNDFARYAQLIENAFDYYKGKLQNQIRLEQHNSNSQIIVAQINLIIHSLEQQKKNFLSNLNIIFDKSNEKNPLITSNTSLLLSALYQYSRHLDRGIVLLENEFEYYLKDHDILKVEAELVNEILEIIRIKNKK